MCSPQLGAAAASILSQNLELQEFFYRGRKRQKVRKIMRDMTGRDREKERVRKIKRDRQTERECEKDSERESEKERERERVKKIDTERVREREKR